ncbi:MAG: hypothetical protein QM535_12790 [Limnohabitans sp.]|nr:hypothetical protein [Limnohabitans sp.]
MGSLIKTFIFGLGGISRYLFFQLINLFLPSRFSKNIDDYLVKNEDSRDKNGLSTPEKKLIIGVILILLIILLLEKLESK